MPTQGSIADFVGRRITVGRVQPGMAGRFGFYFPSPLPTVEQIAKELAVDTEFQGLQLGRFLTTPSGEFIEQAVQLVVPRTFSPEFELIVSGIKLAADIQRGEKWDKALIRVGGGLLLGFAIKELAKSA